MPLDFDTLYRAELPYVVRTLRRLAVREADLDDAAHEMLVDVYEKLHLYDEARPLRPWLFGFAYRVARDFRRRTDRRRTESLDDHAQIQDAGERPEDVIERQQKQRLAVQCLASVPEEQAAVLILHALDDVSIPEIARALSIPLNTAYSRLRLARRAFDAAACQHAEKDDGR
jgi:RNA polymerase sigma-70 factor (ECF subfamily)